MNQQQHKVVIKQLIPELLDDDALDRADWSAELSSLFVGADNVSAIVGGRHCLTYDLEHHRWHHYPLPKGGWRWALARDSARLWGLVDGKFMRLDLRSGEWMEFQHRIEYESILHAEGNAVIAQCRNIRAIDVLRLEKDSLQRITRIPLKIDSISVKTAFWLEENQFIILGNNYRRCTLSCMDWNGELNVILGVNGNNPLLCFPFVVMLDEKEKNLIYADLRENPVKPRYVNLSLCFKQRTPDSSKYWHSAFVFDNSLIVALRPWHLHERYPYERLALIRLGKDEEPEVLCERKYRELLYPNYKFRLLGRFLTVDEERWAYDLVAQREVRDMPWSVLLRQAIHDEAEQKHAASTTTTLMLTQMQESSYSDVGDFEVFWHLSPYCLAEVEGELIWEATSSSFYSIFSLSRTSSVHLLTRNTTQFRCLLPEPTHGWSKATFDERRRVWVCDRYGELIAVIHPDEQEGHGFVLPLCFSDEVQAIAAYDNTVAVASSKELAVYHYNEAEGLLEEMLRWRLGLRSGNHIRGVKPDVEKRGLWVLINSYVLKYLPLNRKTSAPKKVEKFNHSAYILGEWPDKVYFAYIDDNEYVLHYTLNPNKGWHRVSLQNIVHGSYPLLPASMSSDGDAVFVLVRDGNANFLIRLQADNAELISAFSAYSARFVRWGDWLVLYGKEPLAFDQAYADRAVTTELPENKGILFFHLPTNRFYAKPYQPYAITDALRSMLGSGAHGFLKSPL